MFVGLKKKFILLKKRSVYKLKKHFVKPLHAGVAQSNLQATSSFMSMYEIIILNLHHLHRSLHQNSFFLSSLASKRHLTFHLLSLLQHQKQLHQSSSSVIISVQNSLTSLTSKAAFTSKAASTSKVAATSKSASSSKSALSFTPSTTFSKT